MRVACLWACIVVSALTAFSACDTMSTGADDTMSTGADEGEGDLPFPEPPINLYPDAVVFHAPVGEETSRNNSDCELPPLAFLQMSDGRYAVASKPLASSDPSPAIYLYSSSGRSLQQQPVMLDHGVLNIVPLRDAFFWIFSGPNGSRAGGR